MTGTQQGRSTIDAKRAEDVKRLELEDARKQEKRTAVAETKQTAKEIADRERQYRAQARKARKARQREKKEEEVPGGDPDGAVLDADELGPLADALRPRQPQAGCRAGGSHYFL